MLEINNLSKSYATPDGPLLALRDVSVRVNKGDVFGFIGLSGAGKTSLARCVSVLEKADAGEILLNGLDLTKLKGGALRNARRKMGMVFQHFNLLMNATIFENVAFPLRIAGRKKDKIRARVLELLEVVGLSDKANTYPATLSGGQKQRVGIARALAAEPELVICDEATSALDPDTTRSILALLKQIGAATGVTFLVITHEMDVIKTLCSHVAVMEGGQIIEQGKVIDVLTHPQTETARRFFAKDHSEEGWFKAVQEKRIGRHIFRAVFIGESARKSFIHDVIRRFDIKLSILSGSIESVSGTMVGSLILEIKGDEPLLAQAMAYFRENGVEIEEIEELHNA
ncbi:MAG: ATP-binding cassette domain-containing protein [Defluviitaleaceae bacterium]|nr:ATP-binding cassette domain-containing protein [Defluviitaleaceae bacterium]MCL2275424.1 ATP-binding cassette domain-containing protein [Defluviitaleaceae bacterium]